MGEEIDSICIAMQAYLLVHIFPSSHSIFRMNLPNVVKLFSDQNAYTKLCVLEKSAHLLMEII